MSERPYPETIRGAWFLIPEKTTRAVAHREQTYELLHFELGGGFAHTQVKGGQAKHQLGGEYTFDGEFLITRTRASETYRVQSPELTRWIIETPKGSESLHRTLRDSHGPISAELQKELRILPIKARPHVMLSCEKSPWLLAVETEQGALELGVVSVDASLAPQRLWLGVMPLVEGVELRTWLRILTESLLPALPEALTQCKGLDVQFLNDPEGLIHDVPR